MEKKYIIIYCIFEQKILAQYICSWITNEADVKSKLDPSLIVFFTHSRSQCFRIESVSIVTYVWVCYVSTTCYCPSYFFNSLSSTACPICMLRYTLANILSQGNYAMREHSLTSLNVFIRKSKPPICSVNSKTFGTYIQTTG